MGGVQMRPCALNMKLIANQRANIEHVFDD